ncbi:MAG: vanadium-dependent haloperoxidase [Limisphaerales bacterium]
MRSIPRAEHLILKRVLASLGCLLGVVLVAAPVEADPIVAWNRMARDAIRFSNTPPPEAARQMAILHVALHDAIQGVLDGSYFPYRAHTNPPARGSALVAAAVAAAGNIVLRQGWPEFTEAFDAEFLAQSLKLSDGSAKTAGIAWGRQVAFSMVRERGFDGSQYGVDYEPAPGAGHWRPTPPLFASSLLPQWPGVKPFVLQAADQFRPAAPPGLDTAAWVEEFNEVRRLGRRDSAERTAEQTEIAWFWADGVGTETPPGHWNEIAAQLAESKSLAVEDSARLFALLNLALADAGIAAWDAKYAYDLWRPITAIHEASADGNPGTVADPTWVPLVSTPPFPEYVSGHSTFSAAAAAVLSAFHGDDGFSFALRSQSLSGVERRFARFSEAASEAGISRIYGGIHFQSANREGQTLGRKIGEWVARNHLLPRSQANLSRSVVAGRWQLRWPTGLVLQACDRLDRDPWRTVADQGSVTVIFEGGSRFFRVNAPSAW